LNILGFFKFMYCNLTLKVMVLGGGAFGRWYGLDVVSPTKGSCVGRLVPSEKMVRGGGAFQEWSQGEVIRPLGSIILGRN
jgi:S-adenosylmethionine synthetase